MAEVCYYCGGTADGPKDHVPPEILFRGHSTQYKIPKIVTVPSCKKHNAGASAADEMLGWIITDACSGSHVANDVRLRLLQPIGKRAMNDQAFVDQRLAYIGQRMLRRQDDYDDQGNPKSIVYNKEYCERVGRDLQEKIKTLNAALQKIAAGLYYHATNGHVLGAERVRKLKIYSPSFKQVEPTIQLAPVPIDENTYFSELWLSPHTPPWRKVDSGHPDVFQCEVALKGGNSCRFAIRMTFYSELQVWVCGV